MKNIEKQYQFIESIFWKNGVMPLIDLHEERFVGTQIAHFKTLEYPSLRSLIELYLPENLQKNTVYKIRIVYNISDIGFSIQPYQRKKIKGLQLVENENISYAFKYANRAILDLTQKGLPENIEPIIVRDGFLTDSTFTNIALWDGDNWITPNNPLLEGVRREFLLRMGIIQSKEIALSHLQQYEKVKLFNAMVNWEDAWEFSIASILPL